MTQKNEDLEEKIEELKREIEQANQEKSYAIAWAIYFENCLRYSGGHVNIKDILYDASHEIPRILTEAWCPEMAKKFVKPPY